MGLKHVFNKKLLIIIDHFRELLSHEELNLIANIFFEITSGLIVLMIGVLLFDKYSGLVEPLICLLVTAFFCYTGLKIHRINN